MRRPGRRAADAGRALPGPLTAHSTAAIPCPSTCRCSKQQPSFAQSTAVRYLPAFAGGGGQRRGACDAREDGGSWRRCARSCRRRGSRRARRPSPGRTPASPRARRPPSPTSSPPSCPRPPPSPMAWACGPAGPSGSSAPPPPCRSTAAPRWRRRPAPRPWRASTAARHRPAPRALGWARAAGLNEIAWYYSLLHAVLGWACAAAPDGIAWYVFCYTLHCVVPGGLLPAGPLRAWPCSLPGLTLGPVAMAAALLLREICTAALSFLPPLEDPWSGAGAESLLSFVRPCWSQGVGESPQRARCGTRG